MLYAALLLVLPLAPPAAPPPGPAPAVVAEAPPRPLVVRHRGATYRVVRGALQVRRAGRWVAASPPRGLVVARVPRGAVVAVVGGVRVLRTRTAVYHRVGGGYVVVRR